MAPVILAFLERHRCRDGVHHAPRKEDEQQPAEWCSRQPGRRYVRLTSLRDGGGFAVSAGMSSPSLDPGSGHTSTRSLLQRTWARAGFTIAQCLPLQFFLRAWRNKVRVARGSEPARASFINRGTVGALASSLRAGRAK